MAPGRGRHGLVAPYSNELRARPGERIRVRHDPTETICLHYPRPLPNDHQPVCQHVRHPLPNGNRERVENVLADRLVVIREGAGVVKENRFDGVGPNSNSHVRTSP